MFSQKKSTRFYTTFRENTLLKRNKNNNAATFKQHVSNHNQNVQASTQPKVFSFIACQNATEKTMTNLIQAEKHKIIM